MTAKNTRHIFLILSTVLFFAFACNLSSENPNIGNLNQDANSILPDSNQEEFPLLPSATFTLAPTIMPTIALTPTLTSSPTPEPLGVFKLVVIVDLNSEFVSQEEAQAVVDVASDLLYLHTGFVFEMIDFWAVDELTRLEAAFLPQEYIDSNPPLMPNGIILFSYGVDDFALSRGGWSSNGLRDPDGHNQFEIPTDQGAIVVAILDWLHAFGRCGYGFDLSYEDDPISDVSIDGECRNQQGTECVWVYEDYQICSTIVDDLYASTRSYFTSSTIVHEVMHQFGVDTATDHFGTPACQAEMGWAQGWFFDQHEAQVFNGICPFIYDIFVASYDPNR